MANLSEEVPLLWDLIMEKCSEENVAMVMPVKTSTMVIQDELKDDEKIAIVNDGVPLQWN